MNKEGSVIESEDWFVNENEEQFVSGSEEWYVSECEEQLRARNNLWVTSNLWMKDLWLINIEKQFVHFLWD
jgi:hypothetical protein